MSGNLSGGSCKPEGRPYRKALLLGVWTAIVVTLFAGAELVVRVLAPHSFEPFDIMQRLLTIGGIPSLNDIMIRDSVLFWKLKPDLHDFRVSGGLFGSQLDFRVNTDESGMRLTDSTPARNEDAVHILAIGDSCTFGFGVGDSEAWPNKLQGILNNGTEGRHFKVWNGGVPGYSSYQGLRYLQTEGMALRPDIVLAQFWMNDRLPWGWGDYRTASAVNPALWRRLLMKSQFFCFLQRVLMATLSPEQPRLSLDEFSETLSAIVDICERSRVPLIFVIWPSEQNAQEGKLDPYATALESFAKQRGVPCMNVLPAIYQKPGNWYADVCHASPEGNDITARLLAPEVLRVSSPPTKPPVSGNSPDTPL